MALKKVKLKRTAKEVKIKILYKAKPQPVLAVYNYQLKSDDFNPPIEQYEGDNQNSQDDIYSLPTPIKLNIGRFIFIRSFILAVNIDSDYIVSIEVMQDGEVTDTLINEGNASANGQAVLTIDKISFQ